MASELEFVPFKDFVESLTEATEFAASDKSVVSNSIDGPRKMPKTTAEKLIAQSVLSGNVAKAFDATRTSSNQYLKDDLVLYNGELYIFNQPHYGVWTGTDVEKKDITDLLPIIRIPLEVGSYFLAGSSVGNIDSSQTSFRSAKIFATVGAKIFIKASGSTSARLWATFDKDNKIVRKADSNTSTYSSPIVVTIEEGEVGIALNTAFNAAQDRWFGFVDVAGNLLSIFNKENNLNGRVETLESSTEELDNIVGQISEEVVVPVAEETTMTFTNTKTSSTYYPAFVSDTTRASTIFFEVCPGTTLKFNCGSDYDFVLFSSASATEKSNWQDTGWKSGNSTVTCNNKYAGLLVRTSSTSSGGVGATIDATMLAYLGGCTIEYYPYNNKFVTKGLERVENVAASGENPFRFRDFYYYHVMKSGDAVVTPQQSLYDIDAAARLGFKVFEVNTLKVADGYLMQHGQTAKTFANNTVTDLNGDYVNGVDVSGMTIAAIKAAYRYKAKYPKQRTPVTELTEGLVEMKKRGMIPFFSFNVTGADEYRSKVREIFVNDYVAYQGSEDKDATMIMNWSSLNTKEAIVAYCKLRKPPYLHMPSTETISNWILANCKAWAEDPTISDAKTYFNSLSESDQKALILYQIAWFKDLADAVHNEGFLIGWAANYSDEETNQLLMMSSWDCAASGRGVNDFEYGNLVNISADLNFDDFSHTNSSESNGVLSVPVDGYVYASGTIPSCYLGKVAMHIRFNGTLKFTIGGQGNFTLVNDGTRDMYISSIILDNSPQIWIQAITATDIYDLSFKASRC